MLDKKQVEEAVRYNSAKQAEGLWQRDRLLYPLCDADGSEFAAWVCLFQHENGLAVDGKLGPKTAGLGQVHIKGDDFEVLDVPRHSVLPDANGPSNAVIILGKRVRIPQEMIDRGYTMTNYLDDGEPKFKSRKRTKALKWFVQHETCGNTADGCKRTLLKRGLGVQLIQAPDGKYSCHGDVILDRMVHANQLNDGSIGCEVVNPYSPVYVIDTSVFGRWIPRRWWTWVPGASLVAALLKKKGWKKVPKKYVVPTEDQIESMKMFLPWFCEQVNIPYVFPTAGMKKGSPDVKFPEPGIVAHQDFANHADGRYMLEILLEETRK